MGRRGPDPLPPEERLSEPIKVSLRFRPAEIDALYRTAHRCNVSLPILVRCLIRRHMDLDSGGNLVVQGFKCGRDCR